jgi:SAM-dependent methyltransferase
VDLGCGAGDLVRHIDTTYAGVRCIGVDIPDSPEVRERKLEAGGTFLTFDGENIPLAEGSADVIVSRQVLEHVCRPFPLFASVARVLKPGGVFIGSTSQLEPYHSFSTFNYTPFGLKMLGDACGLVAVEFRPGADVLVLVMRRLFAHRAFFDRWLDRESPLNKVIGLAGRLRGWNAAQINTVKLMLAGQFFFVFRKP